MLVVEPVESLGVAYAARKDIAVRVWVVGRDASFEVPSEQLPSQRIGILCVMGFTGTDTHVQHPIIRPQPHATALMVQSCGQVVHNCRSPRR